MVFCQVPLVFLKKNESIKRKATDAHVFFKMLQVNKICDFVSYL